jgi:hypothetical protein
MQKGTMVLGRIRMLQPLGVDRRCKPPDWTQVVPLRLKTLPGDER